MLSLGAVDDAQKRSQTPGVAEWEEIGRTIEAARVRRGLTRRRAAVAAGLNETTLRRLERGDPVKAHTLYQLGRTLLDEEAQHRVFALAGLPFDERIYEEPAVVEQLRNVVVGLRRVTDEAEGMLARLEGEPPARQSSH